MLWRYCGIASLQRCPGVTAALRHCGVTVALRHCGVTAALLRRCVTAAGPEVAGRRSSIRICLLGRPAGRALCPGTDTILLHRVLGPGGMLICDCSPPCTVLNLVA